MTGVPRDAMMAEIFHCGIQFSSHTRGKRMNLSIITLPGSNIVQIATKISRRSMDGSTCGTTCSHSFHWRMDHRHCRFPNAGRTL